MHCLIQFSLLFMHNRACLLQLFSISISMITRLEGSQSLKMYCITDQFQGISKLDLNSRHFSQHISVLFFRFLLVTSVTAQVESQLSLQGKKKKFLTDINFYVQSKKFQRLTQRLAALIPNQGSFYIATYISFSQQDS